MVSKQQLVLILMGYLQDITLSVRSLNYLFVVNDLRNMESF